MFTTSDGVATADDDTLHTMLAQVQRLSRLVDQLLDLSKLESGAIPLRVSRFELRPLLEQNGFFVEPTHMTRWTMLVAPAMSYVRGRGHPAPVRRRDRRAVAHVFYLEDAKRLVEQGIDGFVHMVRDQPVDQVLEGGIQLVEVDPDRWHEARWLVELAMDLANAAVALDREQPGDLALRILGRLLERGQDQLEAAGARRDRCRRSCDRNRLRADSRRCRSRTSS